MSKIFTDLLSKKNIGQFILGCFFVLYLIMGYTLPYELSKFLSSSLGIVVVVLLTVFLLITCNPIVGILAIFVAFELVKRAKMGYSTISNVGLQSLAQFNPKERTVYSKFSPTNQFPLTLEEEMVTKLAPICDPNSNLKKATYIPTLESIYDSAPVS